MLAENLRPMSFGQRVQSPLLQQHCEFLITTVRTVRKPQALGRILLSARGVIFWRSRHDSARDFFGRSMDSNEMILFGVGTQGVGTEGALCVRAFLLARDALQDSLPAGFPAAGLTDDIRRDSLASSDIRRDSVRGCLGVRPQRILRDPLAVGTQGIGRHDLGRPCFFSGSAKHCEVLRSAEES